MRFEIRRLHETFAITTLIDWYRTGVDVQAYLPRLSTYLGHTSPLSTKADLLDRATMPQMVFIMPATIR